MKKVISYLMIGICCFMLCGCTKYPNMKQEDYDLVAEYAAGLLLKYSETSDNRLMSIDEANDILTFEEAIEDVVEKEEEEEPVVDAEETIEESVEETDTPVIDKSEQDEVVSAPIEETMGMDMLSIQLNGYEIKDSYPDESGAFFALDAGEGNKLLVAKVILINTSDSSVDINMLEQNISYKISLDGNGYKFALSTMLLDDLSTYVGTIGSGNSVELVLISEWDEELLNNISNPTLYIKNGELTGKYPF